MLGSPDARRCKICFDPSIACDEAIENALRRKRVDLMHVFDMDTVFADCAFDRGPCET